MQSVINKNQLFLQLLVLLSSTYYTVERLLCFSDSRVDLKITDVQKSVNFLSHQLVPSLQCGFPVL